MTFPQRLDETTQEQTDRYWAVFTYELDMMSKLSYYITDGTDFSETYKSFPVVVQNAVVESHLLHCRNVCDVLLSVIGGANNILLRDLLPDFPPENLDNLRREYGGIYEPGSAAYVLHYNLLNVWKGRTNKYYYSNMINTLSACVNDVTHIILTHHGESIRESLSRHSSRIAKQ